MAENGIVIKIGAVVLGLAALFGGSFFIASDYIRFIKNLKYYIEQAGGYGSRAKKSKAFIIYQNGTMAKASKGKIEPGCEIIVPSKHKKDGTTLAQWLSIGTSVGTLGTMAATIANLTK